MRAFASYFEGIDDKRATRAMLNRDNGHQHVSQTAGRQRTHAMCLLISPDMQHASIQHRHEHDAERIHRKSIQSKRFHVGITAS